MPSLGCCLPGPNDCDLGVNFDTVGGFETAAIQYVLYRTQHEAKRILNAEADDALRWLPAGRIRHMTQKPGRSQSEGFEWSPGCRI